MKEEEGKGKLPLKPLFDALLAREAEEEREKIRALVAEHFELGEGRGPHDNFSPGNLYF